MARLVITSGLIGIAPTGSVFPLGREIENLVGSSRTAQVQLFCDHIPKEEFTIKVEGEHLIVVAHQPIQVRGQPVRPNEKRTLQENDTISTSGMYGVEFQVRR